MWTSRRGVRLAIVAALLFAGQFAALRGVRAMTAAEQCFTETNQCIGEPFLSYWQAHGGLAINGYPLTGVFTQRLEDGKDYQVQYFERARFEAHPENQSPYDVLLGQFGRLIYLTDPSQPRATSVPPRPGAMYFDATGHNLEGKFRAYWEANGGLAQFGLPISEVIRERLEDGKTYDVQYFERARFELHPENAPPYDVLLGQFGRRIVNALSPNAPLPFTVSGGRGNLYRDDLGVRARLGLPTANEAQVHGVIQPFERGAMIWREDTHMIYVIAKDSNGYSPQGNWLGFADTWEEGQTPGGGPAPVPNLYLPQRGFGKVWRDNQAVQQLLGYALTEDEMGKVLVAQPFAGGLLIHVQNAPGSNDYRTSPGIYLLYSNARFEFRYSYGP
jgi:hypothetical protein